MPTNPPGYMAEYYKQNREDWSAKSKARYQTRKYEYWVRGLRTRYGMTPEDYEALLTSQDHACAVCEIPSWEHHNRLHVDHDHKSGKIRGLLCSRCNTAIGLLDEDIERFMQVIEYLK